MSLGKIGTIQGSELIGKPSGFTYEIQNDNTIKVVSSVLVKEESECKKFIDLSLFFVSN